MHVRCRRALKKLFALFLPELSKKLISLTPITLYHAVGVKKYFFTVFGCFCVVYLSQESQSNALRQLFTNYIPFFDPRLMKQLMVVQVFLLEYVFCT